MTRIRMALLLALPLAVASAAAPAGATAFGATLELRYSAFAPVSFSGSGSGASSPTGVTLPAGVLSGTEWVTSAPTHPLVTFLFVPVEGNGAGSFVGSPLGGRMAVKGAIRVKGAVGQRLTLIYVPLFQTHVAGSAAASVGLGLGGSYSAPIGGAAFLRWEHTLWTAGMKTLPSVMYTYVYHVPVGGAASRNRSYTYSKPTGMYTGTDSRTPGGLGRLTLVSPTKVSTNLLGRPQFLVLLGTLTLEFVPEPGTLLLLGAGVAALAGWGRRAARAR